MTEREWLSCDDPLALLRGIPDACWTNERKLRLIASACCRRVWQHFPDESGRSLIEFAERLADGETRQAERARARELLGAQKGITARAVRLAADPSAQTSPLDVGREV